MSYSSCSTNSLAHRALALWSTPHVGLRMNGMNTFSKSLGPLQQYIMHLRIFQRYAPWQYFANLPTLQWTERAPVEHWMSSIKLFCLEKEVMTMLESLNHFFLRESSLTMKTSTEQSGYTTFARPNLDGSKHFRPNLEGAYRFTTKNYRMPPHVFKQKS